MNSSKVIRKSLLAEGNATSGTRGNTTGTTSPKPSNPRPNTTPVPTTPPPKK